jgi:UPF0755 protein
MKKIVILIVFVLIASLGGYLVYREGTLPVNERDTTSVIFKIDPGEPMNDIIKRLESEGLIRNRVVFYSVIKQKGIDKKVQAGNFRLSPSMDAYTLAEELTHGTNDTWITIIEGLRKEEIAEEVSSKLGIPVAEFSAVAREGYLFPDTYLFPSAITAEGVVDTLYKNYKAKVTPDVLASAKERGLNEEQLMILASLVEREARSAEARRMVASIMLKRIAEDMPLQVDATVQYALGYDKEQKTWWRKNLLFKDLEVESPYNTYKNPGLPPAPIASPSLSAILAVSEADPDTPYLFYITGDDGKMYYARDLDEHNRNIDRHMK